MDEQREDVAITRVPDGEDAILREDGWICAEVECFRVGIDELDFRQGCKKRSRFKSVEARSRRGGLHLQVSLDGGGERIPSCSRRTAGASSKQAFVTLCRVFLALDSYLVRFFVGMSKGRCKRR